MRREGGPAEAPNQSPPSARSDGTPDPDPLWDCLQQDDPTDCIRRLDGSSFTAAEVAAAINDPEIPEPIRILLLRQILATLHPGQVGAMVREIEGYLHGNYWTRYAWFESVFRDLGRTEPAWSTGFLLSQTAQDLFAADGSTLLLNIVDLLPDWPDAFSRQMEEGGLGAWGGQPKQIDLAFFLYLDRNASDDPAAGFAYLNASLQSAHYPEADALQHAESSLYFLQRMQLPATIGAEQVDAYLHGLLDHEAFGFQAAQHFLSDTVQRDFPWIGPERTAALRVKAERIVADGD